MGRRKVFTRGIAAVVALVVPFWFTASPASAFESYSKVVTFERTFTDTAGDEVTCAVQVGSFLFRETHSAPFDAEASTQTADDFDNGEEGRCSAFVGVEITYRDRQGNARRLRAFGTDLADLQVDQLGTTFVATHFGVFESCAIDCDFSFTTSPK